MEKFCRKCEAIKPITEFCKRAESPDGLQSHCKACSLEYRRTSSRRKKRAKERQPGTNSRITFRRSAPKMPEGMLVFMVPISDGKDIQAWCDQAMRDYLLSQLRRGEGA